MMNSIVYHKICRMLYFFFSTLWNICAQNITDKASKTNSSSKDKAGCKADWRQMRSSDKRWVVETLLCLCRLPSLLECPVATLLGQNSMVLVSQQQQLTTCILQKRMGLVLGGSSCDDPRSNKLTVEQTRMSEAGLPFHI